MPNDENHRRWLDNRQSPRDWQRLDAGNWIPQAQDGSIVAVRRREPNDPVDEVWPWLVGGLEHDVRAAHEKPGADAVAESFADGGDGECSLEPLLPPAVGMCSVLTQYGLELIAGG